MTNEEQTMKVFDSSGQVQPLGDEIARGGEGVVYPLATRPSVVVKLYHDDLLARRGAALREKVMAMLDLRHSFKDTPVAWPAIAVFDDSGIWRGYAMRRASGVPLSKLAHPMIYRRHVPDLNRLHVARLLTAIVRAMGSLHGSGVCLGDINLNNFLYDHAKGAVTLIDCDSYQLTVATKTYPCLVGAPDMIPPEHHGINLAEVRRTPDSDYLSLSILIFRCLMLGRHPYDFVGGGTVVENLRRGHFPYGVGGAAPGREGSIPPGPWYLIWSHMSFELKALLIRTLQDGAIDPSKRARSSEWSSSLERYAFGLTKGHHDMALRPAAQKSASRRGGYLPGSACPPVATARASL
jgi:DNA-binding helix-hairpin-helix protein with protein kinase domain